MASSAARSKRRHERASRSETVTPPAGPQVWALAWSDATGLKTLASVAEARSALEQPETRIWIDLLSPERELLADVSAMLGLHPLVSEDILERNQRAKIELTGDALHIVMFALTYEGEIVSHEIDVVLGQRFLLTSHDADLDPPSAPFMKREPGAHLAGGPDYVLWALADWIVDGYFPVFDRLGDEIDELEADVMRKPTQWLVERLFQVRRDLLVIRHAVSPQREIFNQLTNRDLTLIQPARLVYFRDIYDHLIRLTDELDSYRELVSTTLDVYLSQVNNSLSEIMKRLTGITVVLAGIGAMAGIFGMSEAGAALASHEAVGFWLVTAAIVTLSLGALIILRRIGWV